ncbi:hypothetical protein C414_000430064 [Campylobacter jejuni subsp. jejuni 414]|nr:hypothetical protein C414_000430064 [Campylobacter jejuni subsp. jejuni 414]
MLKAASFGNLPSNLKSYHALHDFTATTSPFLMPSFFASLK